MDKSKDRSHVPKESITLLVTSINRQLSNQLASFSSVTTEPNQMAHLLADNWCPHDHWAGWL